MKYENILVEQRDNVGLITLHRPKALNALCGALMDELTHAIEKFDADNAIGCMVLTGSEKAFAAGADIKEMSDKTYIEVMRDDFITANWEAGQSTQTDHRRCGGLCAGWRLRAGHDVRFYSGRRKCQIRPAGN